MAHKYTGFSCWIQLLPACIQATGALDSDTAGQPRAQRCTEQQGEMDPYANAHNVCPTSCLWFVCMLTKQDMIHLVSAGFGIFKVHLPHEKSALCLHLPRRDSILHRENCLLSLAASASQCAQQSLGFSRCLNQVY